MNLEIQQIQHDPIPCATAAWPGGSVVQVWASGDGWHARLLVILPTSGQPSVVWGEDYLVRHAGPGHEAVEVACVAAAQEALSVTPS